MPKKKIIQKHHISYRPEITVLIFKGEHALLDGIRPGGLNRRRNISKGFIKALKVWLALNEGGAIELTEEMRKKKAE